MTPPAQPIALPPARGPGSYVVSLVCLGNICRSPTAHVVLEDRLAAVGLDEVVEVVSSGTGGWHAGDPMDARAAATLSQAGYDPTRHRARQFDVGGWAGLDLVLAMDAGNAAELVESAGPGDSGRLMLLRDLDPEGTGDVPDPYYGGPDGFTAVLAMVERCCDALVAALDEQRPWAAVG